MKNGLRKILISGLLLLGVVSNSFAAPFIDVEIPGDGIDNKQQFVGTEASNCPAGVVTANRVPAVALGGCDTLRPEPDKDGDGYNSIGYCSPPNCDPDDTDRTITPYTGPTTKGCSGGQVRDPQGDGSFNACHTWTCPSGYTCKFFNWSTGNNFIGDGSFANPWKDLSKIAYWHYTVTPPFTPYSYSTPHMFIMMGGTYAPDVNLGYGSRAFACRSMSNGGDTTKPNVITSYFGQQAILAPANSTGNHAPAMYFESCDNWEVRNIKISGGYDIGIDFQGGSNVRTRNVIVTEPNAYNDNHACIQYHSTVDSVMDGNIAYDCYKNAAADSPNPSNNSIYLDFRSKNLAVKNLVGFYTSLDDTPANGDVTGSFYKQKHSNPDSSTTYTNLVGFNLGYGGLKTGGPTWSIDHMLLYKTSTCVEQTDLGGNSYSLSTTTGFLDVNHVTCVGSSTANTGGFNFNPTKGYSLTPDVDGNYPILATPCSGSYTLATFRVRNSIMLQTNSTYNVDLRALNNDAFGPDALLDITKLSLSNNGWYNPNATISFGAHEANNGDAAFCANRGLSGQTYTIAQWQTAGFDTVGSGSKFTTPITFDSSMRSNATGLEDKGWLLIGDEPSGPIPGAGALSRGRGLRR